MTYIRYTYILKITKSYMANYCFLCPIEPTLHIVCDVRKLTRRFNVGIDDLQMLKLIPSS